MSSGDFLFSCRWSPTKWCFVFSPQHMNRHVDALADWKRAVQLHPSVHERFAKLISDTEKIVKEKNDSDL